MTNPKTTRDSNIELLRIVLMLMITMHHLITRGCGLREMTDPSLFEANSSTWFQLLVNSLVIVGVNAYVFISGYFGIKFKFDRLLSLVVQALFYSVVLYLLMTVLGFTDFSLKDLIKSFAPIVMTQWWFLSCFLVLYVLSPILNKGLAVLNKTQMILTLLVLAYLGLFRIMPENYLSGVGFSIYNFIFLYVLAQFMRRFVGKVRKPFLVYLASSACIFALAYIAFSKGRLDWAWNVFSYNNLLVVVGAVALFFTFKQLSIQKQWINRLAPFAFGVYLFQEHSSVHPQLTRLVQYLQGLFGEAPSFFGILVILAVCIFVAGILFDKLRMLVCTPIIAYVLNLTPIKKLSSCLDSNN